MREWSNLAKIIYRRTYARRDNGTLETWPQTVARVIRGNVKNFNVSGKEISTLEKLMLARKGGPAGRGLWFSGSPSHDKIGGVALNNCWWVTLDRWDKFVQIQDFLMLGGGVGAGVQHKYVSKLPKVKKGVVIVHKATKDADYIVPDSREGWCELLYRVLDSFFNTGKSFSYSTICVRGYGEDIKGFGGVASGPKPLVDFVSNLCRIFYSREGKALRPIDAGDIVCATGAMVVAGNVRRSAIILIGDCWDKDYLKAKRWDLGTLPAYRSSANYSVVCDDVDDLHPLFWKTFENGEAFGIVNVKNIQKFGRMGELKVDTATGCNPCQPAWATVLTPDGISTMGRIEIGDRIWSRDGWVRVTNKVSTGIKEVRAYKTSAGVFYGTDNHRVLSNGEKVEAGRAASIDTCVGLETISSLDPQDIMDGLMLGDGTVHKASGNLKLLVVGNKDFDYHTSEVASLIKRHRPGVSECNWEVETTLSSTDLPRTYNRTIPDRFFYGAPTKIAGFLRGLFSANGTVTLTKQSARVCLKTSSYDVAAKVQIMLSSLGMSSYITTNKPTAVKFSNGTYLCKQSYDVNVASDVSVFHRSIGFLQRYKTEKLASCVKEPTQHRKTTYDVVSTNHVSTEEVFDITVGGPSHTYWTGGLLVSNCGEATLEDGESCNLLEIPLMNLDNHAEFKLAATTLFRYGKRVSLESYHWPSSQATIHRNMRVGVGVTGCLGSKLFTPDILDDVYKAVQRENTLYSAELGVGSSIRTTTIKPSGTWSKLADQGGYEGIHAAYSKHFIQRIRFSSDDALIPLLRAAGHYMEPEYKLDGTYNPSTTVVDFYVRAEDGLPVADEGWDTWKQLDVLKMAQKYWSDQSVSVSVYYKKDEINKIKDWLRTNLNEIKTISFLCHSDHGYKQAPKEAITESQYNRLSAKVSPIDLEQVGDGALESMECAEGLCPVK